MYASDVDFDERYEDCRYDDVNPAFDEACADVEFAVGQVTGEIRLSSDVVQAAAELLAQDWDIVADGCDDDGNPDHASFVWKMQPLEALAQARPRIAASIRPNAVNVVLARMSLSRPRARSSRAHRRVRRTARTASSRGDPDDDEPGGARPLAARAAR